MKKVCKFFSLLLAMTMLLTSTVSLAEGDVTLTKLTLSDIVAEYTDGESGEMTTLLDLTGLSVELSGGYSEAGQALAQLAVLGGDKTAASAKLAVSDGVGVLSVDGMSKALSLNLAEAMQQYSDEDTLKSMLAEALEIGDDEAKKAALDDLFVSVPAIVSEENVAATMAAFEAYAENQQKAAEGCIVETRDLEENEYVFEGSGQSAAKAYQISVPAEAIREYQMGAFSVYDANPAVLAVLNDILILDDQQPLTGSISDIMKAEMEDVNVAVEGNVYTSADESCVGVAMTVTESGNAENAIDMYADIEMGDDMYISMTINVDAENSVFFVMATEPSDVDPAKKLFSAYMAINEGEDQQQVTVVCGPDETYGDMLMVIVNADGEEVTFGGAVSETGWFAQMYEEDITLDATYTAEGEGTGNLVLTMVDGNDVYTASANVSVTASTVSADEITALTKAEAIDVTTIGEEEISGLTGELASVGMQAALILLQGVPGIGTLLGSMMGN